MINPKNHYDVNISHHKSNVFINLYELLQPLYEKREQRIFGMIWKGHDMFNLPFGVENEEFCDTLEDIKNETYE
tara:strand:+ start:2148 stop:2369 length:222 start_codon:yes stop_codon:yes gene_type:complete